MNNTESEIKGWHRVLILIIPYIFVTTFFQYIGLICSGIDSIEVNINTFTSTQLLIFYLFNFIGTIILLRFFVKRIDKEKFVNIGLKIKNKLVDIVLGIVLGLLTMGLSFFLLIKLNEIHYVTINFDLKEIIISCLFFLIVSITEEVLLRGYVLRNFMYSFDKYTALVFSSVLFSLMHSFNSNIDWFGFLVIFLAGILLGISYIYTKNLWLPISLHFSWNFFQTFFGFNVSGQDFYSVIEFQVYNRNILNGGDFGLEGSVLSIIAQLIIIPMIIYYRKTK